MMKSGRSKSKLHPPSRYSTQKSVVRGACGALAVATFLRYWVTSWQTTSLYPRTLRDAQNHLDIHQHDQTIDTASHFPKLKGEGYEIWQPIHDSDTTQSIQLLSEPEAWIALLQSRYEWLDQITEGNQERPPRDRAVSAYAEMLKNHVSGLAYGSEERSTTFANKPKVSSQLNWKKRKGGGDWAYLGVTMTGEKRLDNVRSLLQNVIAQNIPGDYIETGVWRGGSSIMARGVLRALGESSRRSFVCDSFRGLPPGERALHPKDKGWDGQPYLEVSSSIVKSHFMEAGLLDHGVIFAKGFFSQTMPILKNHIEKLAVMRLDGDMYESTVDVLYNLYDKLSIGGYVIMDDWTNFPSKVACQDFFAVHGFQPKIVMIDSIASYWQKENDIDIQYWRYEKNQFKP